MTIRHHPSQASLMDFAAGNLDRAATALVASHTERCAACRQTVALCETIGGALLADARPTRLAPDALARAMARLDMPPAKPAVPAPRMLAPDVAMPRALDGMVATGWRWLAPGVRRITLLRQTASHGRLYLLRIDPGVRVPAHGHEAWEATCVLAGSFSDETGRFGPGDLVEVGAGHRHRPVAGDTTCICLVAAAGRMRFASPLVRLLQPLVDV
jgi:putative transcriptional regulator